MVLLALYEARTAAGSCVRSRGHATELRWQRRAVALGAMADVPRIAAFILLNPKAGACGRIAFELASDLDLRKPKYMATA